MQRLNPMLSAGALLLALACAPGLAAEPAGPQTHVVLIESMKFTPCTISVRPGDTVEFANTDLVPHTVTERSARAFDSGMISAKATWKLVAGEEGTLLYRCIYHPDMTGKIVVEASGTAVTRGVSVKSELCGKP